MIRAELSIQGTISTEETINNFEGEMMPSILDVASPSERLVKSAERVRDLGEVFTPAATVKEMLDLLPKSIWASHPSPTFFEPACGDGNFLVAILERKLNKIEKEFNKGLLPAGSDAEAAQFHALEALASIYAVDISKDNIVGGTPGHEVGARTRLINMFSEWNNEVLEKTLNEKSLVLRAACWIVEHNLIIGNMLLVDSLGKSTRRDEIPLIEYLWSPDSQTVSLMKTTLGAVIAKGEEDSSTLMSLFEPEAPKLFWKGNAFSLHAAERSEAPKLRGPIRNGNERREG